jgi:hypothetical protein
MLSRNNRDAAKRSIELMQQNGASQVKLNQGYAADNIKIYRRFALVHPKKTIAMPIIKPSITPNLTRLTKTPNISPNIIAAINAISPRRILGLFCCAILKCFLFI